MKNITDNKPGFWNPFTDLPEGHFKHVTTTVEIDSFQMLRSIRPDSTKGRGTIETCFNLLYQKLVNELVKRKITDMSQCERFEDFVVRSKLILPEECAAAGPAGLGNSSSEPLPTSDAPNVRSG